MLLTAEELAGLKKAYLDLLMGKRVVSSEVGGQTREFQRADIESLAKVIETAELSVTNTPLRTYAKNGGVS